MIIHINKYGLLTIFNFAFFIEFSREVFVWGPMFRTNSLNDNNLSINIPGDKKDILMINLITLKKKTLPKERILQYF